MRATVWRPMIEEQRGSAPLKTRAGTHLMPGWTRISQLEVAVAYKCPLGNRLGFVEVINSADLVLRCFECQIKSTTGHSFANYFHRQKHRKIEEPQVSRPVATMAKSVRQCVRKRGGDVT